MSRLAPLDPDAAHAAAAAAGIPDYVADINVFRVLLRHPPIARCLNDMLVPLLIQGTIDARRRELVIMRVGWVTGSAYEWGQHLSSARCSARRPTTWPRYGTGETDAARSTPPTARSSPPPTSSWRAIRSATRRGPSSPRRLPESECIELLMLVGGYQALSGGAAQPRRAARRGPGAWPPDGVGSPAPREQVEPTVRARCGLRAAPARRRRRARRGLGCTVARSSRMPELAHHARGRVVLGVGDAHQPVEPDACEREVAGRERGLGGVAVAPLRPGEAPADLDRGQDLGQEVGDVQTDEAEARVLAGTVTHQRSQPRSAQPGSEARHRRRGLVAVLRRAAPMNRMTSGSAQSAAYGVEVAVLPAPEAQPRSSRGPGPRGGQARAAARSRVEHRATVDHECLAGHVPRRVRQEEQDHGRDVGLGVAVAPHRVLVHRGGVRGAPMLVGGWESMGHRRRDTRSSRRCRRGPIRAPPCARAPGSPPSTRCRRRSRRRRAGRWPTRSSRCDPTRRLHVGVHGLHRGERPDGTGAVQHVPVGLGHGRRDRPRDETSGRCSRARRPGRSAQRTRRPSPGSTRLADVAHHTEVVVAELGHDRRRAGRPGTRRRRPTRRWRQVQGDPASDPAPGAGHDHDPTGDPVLGHRWRYRLAAATNASKRPCCAGSPAAVSSGCHCTAVTHTGPSSSSASTMPSSPARGDAQTAADAVDGLVVVTRAPRPGACPSRRRRGTRRRPTPRARSGRPRRRACRGRGSRR